MGYSYKNSTIFKISEQYGYDCVHEIDIENALKKKNVNYVDPYFQCYNGKRCYNYSNACLFGDDGPKGTDIVQVFFFLNKGRHW